jgi:uncharacterized repeat protein (TIGR01451 family)
MKTLGTWTAALLASAALLGATAGQPPPPMPAFGSSPLLFVRFTGPAGMRATFYQGRPEGRTFDAPVVVGLRPGYLYRVKLAGFADQPDVAVYPTLEVRGSLTVTPKVNPAAYPAAFVLTEADLRSALAGSLVTKVVYLENPDKAVPASTLPGQPVEADLPGSRDLLNDARDFGRPMLVVRVGGRVPPPEELVYGTAPGTILHPGERSLATPRVPPCLPWVGCGFYDPILGPRPQEEECLHDGGDRGPRAGIGADGRLYGLDPEDTVGEYTDASGRRRVVPSNRICLCAPRFAVLRSELPVGRYEAALSVQDAHSVREQTVVEQRTPSLQERQFAEMKLILSKEKPSGATASQGVGALVRVDILEARQLDLSLVSFLSQNAPQRLTEVERTRFMKQVEFALALSRPLGVSGVQQTVGTAALARVEGTTDVVSSVLETRDFTLCCDEPHPLPPDKPLLLLKCADRQAAQPGDVVTFFLRYSNHGGRPLTDVAISDSLSGRLEYVAGSAQSDRDAVFTTEKNEAGSTILRWEVTGRLQAGQNGLLRFQAKVR